MILLGHQAETDMLTVDFAFVDSALEKRRSIRDFYVVGNQVAYSKLKRWIRGCGHRGHYRDYSRYDSVGYGADTSKPNWYRKSTTVM